MIEIKLRVEGAEKTLAYLAGRQNQVRFATAKALTDTANDIKRAIPDALARDLDRPTPFTKRGVFVRAARKDTLTATVGFMDRQAEYLKYQIAGGSRDPGARGLKLPSALKLNEFGNIPRGLIKQFLSVARKESGLSKVKARRVGVSRNVDLFYGDPTQARLPRGIYKDVQLGSGRRQLIPLIVFPRQSAKYRVRFRFAELGERIVSTRWKLNFDAALQFAIATAR